MLKDRCLNLIFIKLLYIFILKNRECKNYINLKIYNIKKHKNKYFISKKLFSKYYSKGSRKHKVKSYENKNKCEKAANKYTDNLEQSNPEQCTKWRDYHREYSKLHYKKLRESHTMLEK